MPIRTLINKLKAINEDLLISRIINTDAFQDFIIGLNTDDPQTGQLFIQSVDSRGIQLNAIGGDYSPRTIEIKLTKGQPVDRVTLRDTGEFYESFRVEVGEDSFTIDADPIKEGGDDLTERWGEDIIGLTDENTQRIIDIIRPFVVQAARQAVLS